MVSNRDVPGKGGDIRKVNVISNMAIMRDMAACHEQVVVTDRGDTAAVLCPGLKRDVFADDVSTTDDKSRIFSSPLEVLRRRTDRCKLENSVCIPDCRMSGQDGMRPYFISIADAYIRTNDDIWPNDIV